MCGPHSVSNLTCLHYTVFLIWHIICRSKIIKLFQAFLGRGLNKQPKDLQYRALKKLRFKQVVNHCCLQLLCLEGGTNENIVSAIYLGPISWNLLHLSTFYYDLLRSSGIVGIELCLCLEVHGFDFCPIWERNGVTASHARLIVCLLLIR